MEKDDDFPAKVHGVKRVSALYQLPYWRVSPINQSVYNSSVVCILTTWIVFCCNKQPIYPHCFHQ